ncbi:MAG: ATP-binding cassette domain-containing protein [Clostridiales bacterium]|nr:ATP-binding cassette domain-containing protein [Clostridiales bacterium]
MISFENVKAGYPGKEIFQGLSLRFPEKGAVALMGPSGLGKTTLLRLVAGLLKPESGKISGTEGKKISFLFQEDRLLPWISAQKNVELVSDRDTATYWLHQMEIENPALYPREMSGGMQRRVSLARSLAFGGDILLLDEPFKGLDEGLRARVAGRIRGSAPFILLSIHDREEAALMGAEIWELEALLRK